jgi:transglutaminase-like putative cysteine protease
MRLAVRVAHGILYAIMNGIRDRLDFVVNATDSGTTAVDAFSLGHGVCQDFSHIFIAAARHIGLPARYVSGYLFHSARYGGADETMAVRILVNESARVTG